MKAILIMLAALPLLAADVTSGHLSGRVYSGGTKQITDAIVTVTTPTGYVSSVVTNKSGDFSFNALPAGEYDFRVTAHGYAIYERQVTVSEDGGVRQLNIHLLVPVDKQTVSVAELRKLEVKPASSVTYNESARRGY